jgi:hypothetical protein
MSHPSTLRALKRRAIGVASTLEYWKGELIGASGAENLYAPKGTPHDLDTEDMIALSLTRGAWRRLIEDMDRDAAEIRKYSN